MISTLNIDKEQNSLTNKDGNKKKILFLSILVLCISLFIIGYIVKDRKGEKKVITKGDRAPEFRLPALDGRFVSLSDFKGKILMVHFWATWCPPCVEEMPTLDGLYDTLRGSGFELIAVSVDEAGTDVVTAFMKKNRLNVPVLMDPDKTISGLYGTYRFPESYIVDRNGIVRYKAIGPRDWGKPANRKIVQDILDAR
jgi:peroxiredoxin